MRHRRNHLPLPLAFLWIVILAALIATNASVHGSALAGSIDAERARELAAAGLQESDDPANSVVSGWLRYLSIRVIQELEDQDDVTPTAVERSLQLEDWLERVSRDPHALNGRRGVIEWAYRSKVDQTGQPFTLGIPDDYDPKEARPLIITLHGMGGQHGGGWGNAHPHRHFELSVLGRGRAGGYIGLSEVDILEATDYVRRHWNIDPRRIHIRGGSMGGGGAFRLAARFPHYFASSWPLAGFGVNVPLENLMHVPLRASHSKDDNLVSFILTEAPIRRLNELGYSASLDKHDGWGHDLWKDVELQRNGRLWALEQVRPETVSVIDYTAQDELARKAYWMEVIEWGSSPHHPRVKARATEAGELYLRLDNVRTARVDVAGSPLDASIPLTVHVNGHPIADIESPLPKEFWIESDGPDWLSSRQAPPLPEHRLHYPGGAMALYHGEPLMVVWGTGGTKEENRALARAAATARQSCLPNWPSPEQVPTGAFIGRQEFGLLPGKPDHEVTKHDLERYNLILLGDARQNRIVGELEAQLPVRIVKDQVVASDTAWNFGNRALGLLYFNPLAPQRLIYWIAADTPDYFRPGAHLLARQSNPFAANVATGLLLVETSANTIVAARHFDSRWNWIPDYRESPVLTGVEAGGDGFAQILGGALRIQAIADFALVDDIDDFAPPFAAGDTRRADVISCAITERIAVIELTGDQLMRLHRTLSSTDGRSRSQIMPLPNYSDLDPDEVLRVAMPAGKLWIFVHALGIELQRTSILTTEVSTALERFW